MHHEQWLSHHLSLFPPTETSYKSLHRLGLAVIHDNPRKFPAISRTLLTTVSSIHPIKHAILYNKTVNNFRISRLLKTKVIHIDEIHVIPTRFGLCAKKFESCEIGHLPCKQTPGVIVVKDANSRSANIVYHEKKSIRASYRKTEKW